MASQPKIDDDDDDAAAKQQPEPQNDGTVRPSISVKLIRHAESQNNQVYRDARYIYRGGTPAFDAEGWQAYIDEHRRADPGLSDLGRRQAEKLADHLVPHLTNQAQHPVSILVSPMRRTCLTIRPTLSGLIQQQKRRSDGGGKDICRVMVHGFYFESEGCHSNEVPQEGMNPSQIKDVLSPKSDSDGDDEPPIDFVGFPNPTRGWWLHGTGPETRAESERRAAKFYLWLCEYLDQQLLSNQDTIFDAGVSIPGEEHEDEHDKHGAKLRRRHTQILVGHGDFMSLVLKRIVAGFGHAVEVEGIPHRSAFVHWNTAITELEYFGKGRWLIMGQNTTPHLTPEILSGGSLKDGWSFLMPNDTNLLHAEVSVAFDDELDDHVVEQRDALKALYLSSEESDKLSDVTASDENFLSVDEEETTKDKKDHVKHFIVKHGHQVVATATYAEATGKLSDVAVRPSAGQKATEALLNAVKQHSKRLGRSGSLLVRPRSNQSRQMFEAVGFRLVQEDESEHLELKH